MENKNKEHRRRLIRVDYSDDKKTHLVFEYQGEDMTEEYEIKTDVVGRYIETSHSLFELSVQDEQKRYLIESEYVDDNTIIDRIHRGDFTNCIFIGTFQNIKDMHSIHTSNLLRKQELVPRVDRESILEFLMITFNEAVNFNGAIFTMYADFRKIMFESSANFNRSIFLDQLSLSDSIFKGRTSFENVIANKGISFLSAKFHDEVRFNNVMLFDSTAFQGAEFMADFYLEYAILYKVIFSTTFKGYVSLKCTVFEQEVSFGGSTFHSQATFGIYEAPLSYFVAFSTPEHEDDLKPASATFKKEVDFSNVKFHDTALFLSVEFCGDVNFLRAKFDKSVNFHNAKFCDDANFQESIFMEDVIFSGIFFRKCISFYNSSVNEFNLQGIAQKIILDLKLSSINKIKYDDIHILDALNRETFLVLKNYALKHNDYISALDFHIKEQNKYYGELRWFKNGLAKFMDKAILGFEKYISYYGTQWYRAFISLLFIIILYVVLMGDVVSQPSINNILLSLEAMVVSLSPFDGLIVKDTGIYAVDSVPLWIKIIKNLLLSVLYYEIIKSFRKFGRRL